MIAAIIILWTLYSPPPFCSKKVKSADETKLAIAKFFTSNSSQALRIIEVLRKDGMTDEYLNNMRNGCINCYIYRERDIGEDQTSWYAMTWIAPQSTKKAIVLEVECGNLVWLDRTLYGG